MSRLCLAVLLAALAAGSALLPSRADELGSGIEESGAEDDDHDRARDLLEHGEIAPLNAIIARLSQQYPGEFVGVRLGRSNNRWIYRFKILTEDGRRVELSVDAKSMDVIGEGVGQ